ncbi:hypothetical protein DFH28DRAFT_1078036 [Melampsora americana]|nr:hypothetical protein DFH28DRAFT_1078036 [Melampsora americana]
MKLLPVPVQQGRWTTRRRPLTKTQIIFGFTRYSVNMSSLQISLDSKVRTAMTATHLNYAMFHDDSEWQYGPMSVSCRIGVTSRAKQFGNEGWMNASHLTNDRRELHVKHIDEYIIKNMVKKESIDLIASWNFINARNQRASITPEQVLHESMRDVFERQSAELKKLWKPRDSLLREVDDMELSVKESIQQHFSEGPYSIWRRIGGRWATKKIGIYYNTRSDNHDQTNRRQRSDPEIESWYHYTTHQYYRVIKSIQEKLKFKPVMFLLSDDLESAFTSISTYMLQFPIKKQYNLIVAPDSHSVDRSSEPHPEKMRKEDRMDNVADYDVITCSLEQSETCDLIFLLGGATRAMGKNPTIRTSIDELALGLSNSHQKLVELARKLAQDPKNYALNLDMIFLHVHEDLDSSPFSLRQWKPRPRDGPQHPLRPLRSAKPINETISRPTLMIGKRSRGNEDHDEYYTHQIDYSYPVSSTCRKKIRRTKSYSEISIISERDITDFKKHEDNQISIFQRSRSFEISLQNRKKLIKRPVDVYIQHPNSI